MRTQIRIYTIMPLTVALAMSACSPKPAEWTEDVQLSDGSVVQITQRREFDAIGEPWRPDLMERAVSLRVSSPNAPPVEWKSDGIIPLLLDRDEGNRYVLVAIYVSRSPDPANRPAAPTPPYLQYELRGADWRQQPLDSRYFDRRSNLLQSQAPNAPNGKHYGVAEKEALNRDPNILLTRRFILEDATFADDRIGTPARLRGIKAK